MKPVKVLCHLDHPIRLLYWTMDELLAMMIPYLLGIWFGSFSIIIAGAIFYRYYKKMKRRYPSKIVKAWIYWHFPTRSKWMIPSHQRHFVG